MYALRHTVRGIMLRRGGRRRSNMRITMARITSIRFSNEPRPVFLGRRAVGTFVAIDRFVRITPVKPTIVPCYAIEGGYAVCKRCARSTSIEARFTHRLRKVWSDIMVAPEVELWA